MSEETNDESSRIEEIEPGGRENPANPEAEERATSAREAATEDSTGEGATSASVEAEALSEELDDEDLIALISALLYANGEALSVSRLVEISRQEEPRVTKALDSLAHAIEQAGLGVELVKVADQYQIRTMPVWSERIRLLKAERPRRLSMPALETLAVVAYRQPVVKSDIEKIRGVDVTPTLKTLLERKLIKIVGHTNSVGQPALYGTTDEFLKVFSLESLTQLPTLRDLQELESDPGETRELEEEDRAPAQASELDESVEHHGVAT